MFERFGRVTRVFLAKDRETNMAKGFAFISFADRSDAAVACEKMDGCKLNITLSFFAAGNVSTSNMYHSWLPTFDSPGWVCKEEYLIIIFRIDLFTKLEWWWDMSFLFNPLLVPHFPFPFSSSLLFPWSFSFVMNEKTISSCHFLKSTNIEGQEEVFLQKKLSPPFPFFFLLSNPFLFDFFEDGKVCWIMTHPVDTKYHFSPYQSSLLFAHLPCPVSRPPAKSSKIINSFFLLSRPSFLKLLHVPRVQQ